MPGVGFGREGVSLDEPRLRALPSPSPSHKWRGDPLAAIRAWFWAANLVARVTLILAFSHEGLIGVGLRPWERGRPARNAARKRGDTLILAFSHEGRRDPLTAIHT